MNCRRVAPLLSRLVDRHLSGRAQAEVLTHLRDCPVCRDRRDAIQRAGDTVRLLSGIAAPPGIESRIAERWLRELDSQDRQPGLTSPALRGVAAPRRRGGPASLAFGAAVFLVTLCLIPTRREIRPHHRPVRLGQRHPSSLKLADSRPTQSTWHSRHTTGSGQTCRAAACPLNESYRASSTPMAMPSPLLSLLDSNAVPAMPGDDLIHLNGVSPAEAPSCTPPQEGVWEKIEERIRRDVRVRDDFVRIPFPRLATTSERQIARAVESYRQEAAVVDARLAHEVTLREKGAALSDLCDTLRAATGIELKAGPSVADAKVTILCEKQPLREVMRQLSRPFGYTWLRTGSAFGVQRSAIGIDSADPNPKRRTPNAEYRYELAQDLKSQLLEEELRNRDRNEALLALDREIQQFRPYLDLSPDQALEKAKTAPPAEKQLLERLSGLGWGVAQLYFRLSPEQVNRLRAGQELEFLDEPEQGKLPLPQEMASEVLSSLRHRRLLISGDGVSWGYPAQIPNGLPPAQVVGAHPLVHIQIVQSELGQYTLEGFSGLTLQHPDCVLLTRDDAKALGPLATGISPSAQQPNNAAGTARYSTDPALQRRVAVTPGARRQALDAGPGAAKRTEIADPAPPSASRLAPGASKVTSADVLEALHRATAIPIVADYYTRLHPTGAVSCGDQRLYDVLNRLADAMRLRWRKEGEWLQFRSAGYFQDRLKEVPNRLLDRWAAERRRRGFLTLDGLLEIAALSDAQLDASAVAEGAKELYGLEEWDLARNSKLRPHWRFLAALTPAQRQEAAGAPGLAFTRLTLPQQQEFLRLALGGSGDAPSWGLQEMAAATLRISYTVPGWFQWPAPGTPDTTLPGSIQRPSVREQTRAAALEAARKLDPGVTAADVVPTSLDGVLIYTVGAAGTHHAVRVVGASQNSFMTD